MWINFTLAALSSAENAAVRFLATGLFLVFLIIVFTFDARFLLRIVLTLSFLTFFMALLIIGIFFSMPISSYAYDRHRAWYGNTAIALSQAILLSFQ